MPFCGFFFLLVIVCFYATTKNKIHWAPKRLQHAPKSTDLLTYGIFIENLILTTQ